MIWIVRELTTSLPSMVIVGFLVSIRFEQVSSSIQQLTSYLPILPYIRTLPRCLNISDLRQFGRSVPMSTSKPKRSEVSNLVWCQHEAILGDLHEEEKLTSAEVKRRMEYEK